MRGFLLLPLLGPLAQASLMVDYKAGDPVSALGSPQIQKAEEDKIVKTNAGNNAYVKLEQDDSSRGALHFHREPSYRRAEVRAKGEFAAGRKYFVGYQFRLSNVHQHLSLFQWKKEDKTEKPVQNIPFNLQFTETEPTKLSIGYTEPGEKYATMWTDENEFATDKTHNIALAFDTNVEGSLQMWLDGRKVFDKSGLKLWTGDSYPKFGIYRGEKGDHDGSGKHPNEFDMWLYRLQISDTSLEEVSESSGVRQNTKRFTA